jgi:CHAT domain-containing protein/tetratricopeptide (TPR) repeat protein
MGGIMERAEVAAALEALLAAPTADEGLAVLRRHAPAFRDPAALELLDSNIERCRDDPDTRDLLENRRLIVSEFQRAGLDGAQQVMQGDRQVGEIINGWLACEGWDEAFHYLESNRSVLLGSAAARLLEDAAQRHARDPQAGPHISACRALAQIAADHGLTEARLWLCGKLLAKVQDPDRTPPPEERASYYQTLLRLTDPAMETATWVGLNINLGSALRDLDRPAEAIGHFNAALEHLSAERDPEAFSGAHRMLGNIYFGQATADPEQAIFHFNQSLLALRPRSDPANYLHVHHTLGLAHSRLKQRDQAMFHLQQALDVPTEASPDQWAQAAADLANELLNDYGKSRQPSLREAIGWLEKGLAFLDPQIDADRWARSQRNLGMVYRDIEAGDRSTSLEKAAEHTSQALKVWTREENPYGWAQLQHNLGTIFYLRLTGDPFDNLNQAAGHYAQALSVHTRAQYPDDWALTKSALGMCLSRQHELSGIPAQLEAAIEHIRQSLDWWEGEGRDQSDQSGNYRAEAGNALGGALLERVRYGGQPDLREGIAQFERAEALYAGLGLEERRRSVLMNLARAYELLTEADASAFPRALEFARQALAITPRETDPYSWAIFQRNYAALMANSGDAALRDDTVVSLEGALEVFTREAYPGEHCRTQGYLGHTQFQDRDWGRALAAYSQAVDTAADMAGMAYTESGRDYLIAETSLYFMRAAFCLAELDRPGEALVMLDRGKGRALSLDLSVKGLLSAAVGEDQGRALADTHLKLVALEAEMRLPHTHAGRRSDADLGNALKSARENFARLVESIGISVRADLDLDEILAAAPAGGALVAMLVTSAGSLAFVVPAGTSRLTGNHLVRTSFSTVDLHAMLLGDEHSPGLLRTYLELKSETDDARGEALAVHYADQLNACCEAIWHELLADIAMRLEKLGVAANAPLCLLPQGGLGMLPLHAARDTTVPAGQPGCWPLLERYEVFYAPSAYLLTVPGRRHPEAERSRQALPSVVGAVNPTNDLNFAEIEGALLNDLFTRRFGADGVRFLRGENASLNAVKPHLNHAEYLHFACHGAFNFRDAGRSALYLAGSQPLELAELMGPEFDFSRNRLVTLSACETGMTEFQRSPDEYVGLPATFMRAGSPAVLSTLWQLDDISGAILSSEFYRRHIVENQPPAQALRGAQLWLCRASHNEVTAWLNAAAARLTQRIRAGERHLERVVPDLESLRREIEGGALGAVPFEQPWFWAAFTLMGR